MKVHSISHLQAQKWTVKQIQLFIQKFLVFRYDFQRISEFYANKKVKEIIELYYLVKKGFKLSKLERQVQGYCNLAVGNGGTSYVKGGRWGLVQKLAEELIQEWFAK